jgi:hypothetical protein
MDLAETGREKSTYAAGKIQRIQAGTSSDFSDEVQPFPSGKIRRVAKH